MPNSNSKLRAIYQTAIRDVANKAKEQIQKVANAKFYIKHPPSPRKSSRRHSVGGSRNGTRKSRR